jgi:hypothetical protein
MARVTSNLKTSEMMRKGINPETVNALATLWRARFEELTARAQEQGVAICDFHGHVSPIELSLKAFVQVLLAPMMIKICLPLPMMLASGEEQPHPRTLLRQIGSMAKVLIRQMALAMSAVMCHAMFVPSTRPVRASSVSTARMCSRKFLQISAEVLLQMTETLQSSCC